MSKKPGIGHQYLTRASINFHNYGEIDFFQRDGVKRCMPRYYFDRIFDHGSRCRIRKRQLVARDLQEQKDLALCHVSPVDHFAGVDELNRYSAERVGSGIVYQF